MATEEYGLIAKVDATSANKASRDLDGFTASAAKADAANAKLADGAKTSASSLSQHAQESRRAEQAVSQLAETEQQAQQRIHAMVQASMAAQRADQERAQAAMAASQATTQSSQAEAAALAERKAASAALLASQNAQMAAATEMARAQATLDAIMGASKMTTAEVAAAEDALDAIRKRGVLGITATDQAAMHLAEVKITDTAITKANTDALVKNTAAKGLNARASYSLSALLSDAATGQASRSRRELAALGNETGLISKLFTPLGAIIGVGAAGLLAYVKAAYSAEAATSDLNKAILATGGAAGVTTGQLGAMAVALVDGKRSAGDIHDALIAVVSSGKFAGDQIQTVAGAALDMANVTGQSVSQAVAQFAKLGDDPVSAAAKLNDSYHFLTQSVYDQINALQQQGDTEGATKIAVDALAQSMDTAAKKAEEHIGTLHAMWKELKRDLALPADLLTAAANHATPDAAGQNAVAKQMLEMYKQQGYFTESASGDFSSTDKFSRLLPGFQQTMLSYVSMYNKTRDAAADAANAAQGLADRQKDLQGVIDDQAWVNHAIKGFDTVKERAQAAADVSQKLFNLLLHGQPLPAGVQVAPGSKGGFTGAGFDYLVNKELGTSTRTPSTRNNSHNLDRLRQMGVSDLVGEVAAEGKAADANKAYNDQLTAQLALRKNAIDLQVESAGMGQKEIQRMQEQNQVYQEFNRQLASLNKERDRGAISASDYQKRLADLNAAESDTIDAMLDGYKRLDAAQADWRNGFVSGIQDVIDQGTNVAGMMHGTVTDFFDNMTDAIVNFAQTGKLSLSDLVQSFMADMLRMEMRVLESQILTQLFGNMFGVADNGSAGFASYESANLGNTAIGFNAKGGVYDSPSLSRYSNGVYDSPQFFAFAKGAAVFAEAGPEAIVPLSKDSNGKLGIKSQGSGTNVYVDVEINGGDGNAKVSQQQSTDAQGNQFIKLIIDQAANQAVGKVNQNIARNGSTGQLMAQTFGLSRRGVPVAG